MTASPDRWAVTRRDRLHWWGSSLVGVVAVIVGVLLATRPLTSLEALALYLGTALVVLAVAAVVGDRQRSRRDRVAAITAGVLGVVILLWLRHDFDLLALAVGVALVIAGAGRLWGAARLQRQTADGLATGLLGTAEIIIGVLAVRWPDLTLLAVAVLFAVRLVAFGLGRIRRAIDHLRGRSATPREQTVPPWMRLVGGALALVLALGVGWLGLQARAGAPMVDAFYATPGEVPAEPGAVLRSEPFTRDVPAGATGWRILYTTTAADGSAATASAIVLTPSGAGTTPAPVIAWAHGTTGFATQCAPSLLEHPFEAGAMPALEHVVDRGWALVATDYTGLGTPGPHPYLIGASEGHSVLDALRAAQKLTGANLAPETVVWGHSQGGHAALWTGQLAADYAPELELQGVAALAPAADVTALATSLPDVTGGTLFASFVIAAYAAHYPDITLDEQVIPPARTLVREMAGRCLAEPSIVASVISVLSLARDQSVYATPPAEGALGERLRENVPTGPFTMPVLVAQGEADTLILPEHQQAYIDRLCAAGESPEYRTYPERDHLSLVEPESELIDDLLQWTAERFDSGLAAEGCG